MALDHTLLLDCRPLISCLGLGFSWISVLPKQKCCSVFHSSWYFWMISKKELRSDYLCNNIQSKHQKPFLYVILDSQGTDPQLYSHKASPFSLSLCQHSSCPTKQPPAMPAAHLLRMIPVSLPSFCSAKQPHVQYSSHRHTSMG